MDATRRYSNLDKKLEGVRTQTEKIGDNGQSAPPRPAGKAHRIAQRLDEATIQQLVQDYGDGIPTTRLATKYELAKGAVLKILREHGVVLRDNRGRVRESP